MSDEQEIWERQEGEPNNWYARFLLYRNMGPSRTLLGTVNLERAKRSEEKRTESIPGSWFEAFKQWEWRKRAEAWDEEEQRIALAECKYARVSERAKLLERWIDTQDSIMLSSLAENGYARSDTMEQFRGLLDDMAKETGGRVRVSKAEVTHDTKEGARARLMQKLESLLDDDDGADDGSPVPQVPGVLEIAEAKEA